VIREHKIPTIALMTAVSFLAVGEFVSGTSLYFIAMMVVAMLSIGVTYNLLGGLGTFSGIIFSGFALRTLVISQFAKVLLFEAADKNLEVPQLTIAIYAVFYFSGMLGAFVLSGLRLPLPRPMEPKDNSHANLVYAVSLTVGLVATVIWEGYYNSYGSKQEYSQSRSAALAFSTLLLFALVMAVGMRIRRSGGRHSFGWAAFVPWIVTVVFGFIDSVRTAILAPSIVYLLTCYVHGYRLRRRHYIALVLGVGAFFSFISPFELYTRDFTRDLNLRERALEVWSVLELMRNPSVLSAAWASASSGGLNGVETNYYNNPSLYSLSRLSEIRNDSNLIVSCANGSHYGLAAIKIDLSRMVPSFLNKNKERYGGENYLGHIAGATADEDDITQIEFSAAADSYGGFGWFGVVLFPFFCLPLVYIVNESIFGDLSQPWSTVGLGTTFLLFGGMNMGRFFILTLRNPVYIVLLSYLVMGITKAATYREDDKFTLKREPGIEA
jgi:hypothetical protein